MTVSVVRLGETIKWKEFFRRSIIYLSSSIVSGSIVGFVLSLGIYLLTYYLPITIKIGLLVFITGAYIFHEFKFIKIKVLQNKWQIPTNWVNYSPGFNMIVWGRFWVEASSHIFLMLHFI